MFNVDHYEEQFFFATLKTHYVYGNHEGGVILTSLPLRGKYTGHQTTEIMTRGGAKST